MMVLRFVRKIGNINFAFVKTLRVFASTVLFCSLSFSVQAQPAAQLEVNQIDEAQIASEAEEILSEDYILSLLYDQLQKKEQVNEIEIYPEDLGTLFFTFYQHSLLQDAKRALTSRTPASANLDDEENKPTGPRELALAGINFRADDKWTIYLNGERITPQAVPEKILDISVSDQYVDLKWFDDVTNVVFPIRLRPNQRFNLDARMFLPGVTP